MSGHGGRDAANDNFSPVAGFQVSKRFYGQAAQAIHICEDQNGNAVVYKGSGEFVAAGDTAYVIATISEHSIYNDRKQTIIQRPRVVAVVIEKELV